MTQELDNFLLSLAAALATAAGIELAATPRALWVHEAIEDAASDPFTVLRVYGGTETASFSGVRSDRCRIQLDTRGTDASATLARAWRLHAALLDAHDRPRLHWSIAGKHLVDGQIEADPSGGWAAWVCDLTAVPGIVGRDEGRRYFAPDNFEIEFERDSQ